MVTTVQLEILLHPVGRPWIDISVHSNQTVQQLNKDTVFRFDFETKNSRECLSIAHFGKDSDDAESAVIIKQISFFGIADPRFVWLGQYTPVYPEPWLGQQTPEPPVTLNNTDYLGWNGVWQLDFSVPVFTWIHQVQSLGWIHP
jgi:hypothetical protein